MSQRLTDREYEVLRLVAHGLTTSAVAEQLHISTATAEKHIVNLRAKMHARNKIQLVAQALKEGVLTGKPDGTTA